MTPNQSKSFSSTDRTERHTPGPWTAVQHYSDSVSVVDAQGFQHVEAVETAILLGYADKLGIDHWADSPAASREVLPEEQAANARLIAAAPELLRALHVAVAALEDVGHEYPASIELIRAAIKKASA